MARTRLACSRSKAAEQEHGVTDATVIAELRASAAAQIAALAGCWNLDADQFGGDLRRALDRRHAELATAQQILATLHQLARRLAMQCHGSRKHQRQYRRLAGELDLARQVAASASLGLLRSVFATVAAGAPPRDVAVTAAPPPAPLLALIRSATEPARRTA
jgi:hypothetical protein